MVASLISFYLRSTPALLFAFFLSLFLLILPTMGSSLGYFLTHPLAQLSELIIYTLVGLSFSLLASLSAWPFALTFSTLILHKKERPIFKVISIIAYFLSGIPILLFAYVIIEVLGKNSQLTLTNYSFGILSTSNLITQTIAFAFTILFYPLTIVPGFYHNLSVDLLFHEMLNSVIRFAELGFISFVVVFALFLYILPKMIVKMFYHLRKDQSLKNYEVIQSLGGTNWESLYISSLHAMKSNFNLYIVQFTKICFLEGIVIFSLINFYLVDYKNLWGKTMSSVFIKESIEMIDKPRYIAISGILVLVYLLFVALEYYYFQRESKNV